MLRNIGDEEVDVNVGQRSVCCGKREYFNQHLAQRFVVSMSVSVLIATHTHTHRINQSTPTHCTIQPTAFRSLLYILVN